ncbi:MAG: response regulator, partial [Oscillospiraceae bacterium]|nr:response regulator [Oscillospiraceae bacterium]
MDIQNKKGISTTHFLIGSFTLLLLISIGAFICLGQYMSRVSEESIDKVGDLYMSGINDHISAHFHTLIELKLEQAEAITQSVPTDVEELHEELIYRGRIRNFSNLALCSDDGNMEMLYGDPIQLADPDPFFESLRNNEKKVAVGRDSSGNEVVMFGIEADYPMKNGRTSMAIVTAVPIEYISTMLSTEEKNSIIFSHIIRKDGSFIASDMSGEYTDYFNSLYARYQDNNKEKIDKYVREISEAMERKENFYTILDLDGSSQKIYCTSLPYSEWYLLAILPFGDLNETVENLNRNSMGATMLISAIIIVVLLIIFYIYFKMTCRQVNALEKARQEALEANKAKSMFLSNMSHDIRTPMNAIVGMTAIATAHIDDKEQVQNCLRKIALSGKHLLGLINDVLDMSKIESGKMTLTSEQISLREVVEGIVSIVQTQIKAKSQNFNVHIDNIITEDVFCDSVRLNQ